MGRRSRRRVTGFDALRGRGHHARQLETWRGVVTRTVFAVIASLALGAVLTGCPTTDSGSAPASPTAAAAACTEGQSKCTGTYAGEVAEGNNAPAGATVATCKEGSWAEDPCDASANEGCYAMEDPGSGEIQARCLSAMDTMGE